MSFPVDVAKFFSFSPCQQSIKVTEVYNTILEYNITFKDYL